jgi:hypothetical protein
VAFDPHVRGSVDEHVGDLAITQQALDRSQTRQRVDSISDLVSAGERRYLWNQRRCGSRQRFSFERNVGLEEAPDDSVGHTHAFPHTRRQARIHRSPGWGARPESRALIVPDLGLGNTTAFGGTSILHAER